MPEASGSARTLCVTADIEGWSRRLVPEQIKAQQTLLSVLDEACANAGLDRCEWTIQQNGDGEVSVLPPGVDEAVVIPALIRELATSLRQANRHLSTTARIRLRLAMTAGLVHRAPNGLAGFSLIEACRLLDSAPVKAALRTFPKTDLAVIVSDFLYRDVIVNDFRDLRSTDFWKVTVELKDKEFAGDAWVYVSDRSGGPEPLTGQPTVAEPVVVRPPPAAPAEGPSLRADTVDHMLAQWRAARDAGPAGAPPVDGTEIFAAAERDCGEGLSAKAAEEYASLLRRNPDCAPALLGLAQVLRVCGPYEWAALELLNAVVARTDIDNDERCRALNERADLYSGIGSHELAISDLEELTRLLPDLAEVPGPQVLLRLGQSHADLGATRPASQVWHFLLDRRPFEVEAYLRIGLLGKREHDYETARLYLTEGLRIVRAHPEVSLEPQRLAKELLLGLSEVADARGDAAAADQFLNEAANTAPDSPDALILLAYRAGRRHDRAAMHRLYSAALARVPPGLLCVFAAEEGRRAATATEGDVILELLLDASAIDRRSYDDAMAARSQSRADVE